jgi:hypothetical protein
MKTLSLTCLLLVIPGSQFAQDRAHELASQASNQHPAKCPKTKLTLQQCHDQFPDGCSNAAKPNYDAYLDFLKDQVPAPDSASTSTLVAADFRQRESQLSHLTQHSKGKAKKGVGLTSSNHATFASQFAGLGEGNIYTVIAYLYFAEDTGNPPPGQNPNSEICNCKLLTPNTFDYHIGFGFNSALAAKARSTHSKPGDPALSEWEKDSVVAEMTPYIRSSHPNWSIDRVSALQGQQVKIVGQLMVDNEHFKTADDCALPGASANCWRSTIWEIHPIVKISVCNLATGCDASSPDSAWTDLDKQ